MDYPVTIPDYSEIGAVSQTWDNMPPEGFSEVARSYEGHNFFNSSGPASHSLQFPSVLSQSPRSNPCFTPGVVSCQGRRPLDQGCGPLDDVLPVPNRNEIRPKLQKEGSHNRQMKNGLGRPVGGHSGVWLLISPGAMPAYQLPRNVSFIF